MRAFRLVRVGAEAEVLRLRRRVRRIVVRAAMGAVGALFALAALALAHVAVFGAINHSLGWVSSALVVFGGDLLIALILLILASVSSPDRVETEALQVRRRAQEQLEEMLATAALAAPIARAMGRPRILGAALAIFLPRVIASFRRR